MTKLERLARLLTGKFGEPVQFEAAMLAKALRSACEPDTSPELVTAFLRALADAFDGVPGPRARIAVQGRKADLVTARGVTQEALDVHEFVADAANVANAGSQEILIEKVARGDWPGGKAISKSRVKDHLRDVREFNERLRKLKERASRSSK